MCEVFVRQERSWERSTIKEIEDALLHDRGDCVDRLPAFGRNMEIERVVVIGELVQGGERLGTSLGMSVLELALEQRDALTTIELHDAARQ
jgi:hypothetical protein